MRARADDVEGSPPLRGPSRPAHLLAGALELADGVLDVLRCAGREGREGGEEMRRHGGEEMSGELMGGVLEG